MNYKRNKVNGIKQLSLVTGTVFLSAITAADIANAVTAPAPVVAAIISQSTATPKVGQIVTFDGTASVCNSTVGCSYTWQWYWRSPDNTTTYLGGQMGRTKSVKYQFNALAAAKRYVIVVLTVGEGRVRKSSTARVAFRVLR